MNRLLTLGVIIMVAGCTRIYDTDEFKFQPSEDTASDGATTCQTYCETVMDVCVAENAQFATAAQCMQICAYMIAGDTTDISGNSLACRDHFALEAIESAGTHCRSAGPGGNGVCGGNCESFCQLQNEICTGANVQFNSVEACLSACATIDDSVPYNNTIVSGNSLSCRLSHLSLASGSPDVHCSHLALDSPVCN
ncbi:MAG: hypothetical protein JXR76_23980 [Deltaproteobacteria bacterium]|nr:hypothetical protein [Deltaproteobacteria bacterium]